jgi:hypothetical protein
LCAWKYLNSWDDAKVFAVCVVSQLGSGRWGDGGLGFCGGDGVAGEEVFLIEGGAFELEGEFVEAFFEEEVVALAVGLEGVQLACGEADFGEIGGGEDVGFGF